MGDCRTRARVSTGSPITVLNQSQIYATFVSPAGRLHLQDNAHAYGSFTGQTVYLQNQSGLHIDSGGGPSICGNTIADTPGASGVISTGAITAEATFDQWYRDVLDVNFSMPHGITLVRDGSGVYEYISGAFHPIDGKLHVRDFMKLRSMTRETGAGMATR